MVKSVAFAGFAFARALVSATQIQAPATIADATSVIEDCARPNHARRLPEVASAAAGNANGSTQHTPQRTAPAAANAAALDAAVSGWISGRNVPFESIEFLPL
jgi:hypothetical protein